MRTAYLEDARHLQWNLVYLLAAYGTMVVRFVFLEEAGRRAWGEGRRRRRRRIRKEEEGERWRVHLGI